MQAPVIPSRPEPHQQLEHTSRLMLAAAQRSDWSEVRRLEGVAQGQVAALRLQAPRPAPAGPAERQARQRALLAVLRHDAQVRALAEPVIDRVTQGRPQLH
ncbi:flagellar protein FliT [Aquabacterium sp. A08]|uniref:flagellar protein FliT n=1 Tax=Aquabacterium sp. A08 TaxID=2718532 RepID=UPI001424884A|nr:flagellar protein FliT [Aquabacterium sp. A08]NIC41923.1 flagellar protein FliT [Aquabacterium sp. A08]NIC41966.1 flagellar protein FliT [Aquabacterium sp. A08]